MAVDGQGIVEVMVTHGQWCFDRQNEENIAKLAMLSLHVHAQQSNTYARYMCVGWSINRCTSSIKMIKFTCWVYMGLLHL